MQNFLVCDVPFTFEAGVSACNGSLMSITSEELGGGSSSLTWQQVSDYQEQILLLFALVFGFLVIRKML